MSPPDSTPVATPLTLDDFADEFEALFAAQRRLRGRDAMVEDGVSFAQFRLIRILARDGAMSASRLAEAAAITPSSATQMLDALELRKLVKRTRSETDRRVVIVGLTAEGRRRSDLRRAANRAEFARAFADFTGDEIAVGVEALRRYARYLDAM